MPPHARIGNHKTIQIDGFLNFLKQKLAEQNHKQTKHEQQTKTQFAIGLQKSWIRNAEDETQTEIGNLPTNYHQKYGKPWFNAANW